MLITAITHASARHEEHLFRGLTEEGMDESRRAAARYRALLSEGSFPPIARIISSPKP